MAKLLIELPDDVIAFLEQRAAAAGYDSAGTYLAAVALEELGATVGTLDELHARLQEGVDSGPAVPMTAEDWDSIRREGQSILQALKARKR